VPKLADWGSKTYGWAGLAIVAFLAVPTTWAAGTDHIPASVQDNAGGRVHSATRELVSAVGQPGGVAVSGGAGRVLHAGFMAAAAVAAPLSRELLSVMAGELRARSDDWSRRQTRSADAAIRFLEKAIAEYDAAAEAGRPLRLVQVLNDVRQAVHFMGRLGAAVQGTVRTLTRASATSARVVVARASSREMSGAVSALALYEYGEKALGHRDYRGALEYFKDAVETVKQA